MAGDADDLIARLAAEGELDGDGGFTLDPEVALDKLRDFQLSDPTRFVLSWVRAATLLGASRIDIEIDADDVWFRFDGQALAGEDFDELWSSVFGRKGSTRVRACRELALGINGAFAWQARGVTIDSAGLRVAFDRRFEMTRATLDDHGPRSGTTTVLHAKRPLGWELVRRRYLDGRGELPEELLLARACAHGRVPIYLEGRRLNPEPAPPPELRYRLRIDGDGRVGFLLLRPGAQSRLRVLESGVEVGEFELPFGRGWVEALIDDPLLPLDLSQGKPVEGQRWRALLDCVARARWHAYFALAALERWSGQGSDALEQVVVGEILSCPDRSWTTAPGAFDYANRLELPRAVSDPLGGFRTLGDAQEGPPAPRLVPSSPVLPWPPPSPEALTLGTIVRFALRRGFVFTSATDIGQLPFVPELPVVRRDQLEGLNPVALTEAEGRARYQRALRELRPLSGDRALPDGWLELRHQHGALQVRLAWCAGRTSVSAGALIVGRDGQCLAQFSLPSQWGPLWAEVEGPFEDPELADQAGGQLLATAVLAVLERYGDLLAGLDSEQLSDREREVARRYSREGFGRWSARRLAELEHIPVDARERALAQWSGGWGVPSAWVDAPPGERGLCEHGITKLAWIERGDGYMSLRDAQRDVAVHGRLVFVDPSDDSLSGPGGGSDAPPSGVWRLTARDRAILSDFFHGALEPFDACAWRRRAPGGHALPGSLEGARACVELDGPDGERGLLALPEREVPRSWSCPPRRGARLRLLANGHELGWMDLPLPLGPFYGVIEVPRLGAVAHADVAVKDDAWRAAADIVSAGARELARAQLDAWIAGQEGEHDLALVTEWTIALERGEWPSFAAALRAWQSGLSPTDPLRVDLDQRKQPA